MVAISDSQVTLHSLATLLYIATYAATFMYTTQPSALTGGGNLNSDGWVVFVRIVSFVAWWFCGALTSLLFFFRVLAVFKHSRTKKVVFSLLWGLTGCATFPLLNTVAIPQLPAAVCQLYIEEFQSIATINSCPERAWLAMILLILIATHHILIFISISHELLGNNTLSGVCNMRTMITGNGLHTVSKSLLRSSQLYVG